MTTREDQYEIWIYEAGQGILMVIRLKFSVTNKLLKLFESRGPCNA